MRHEKGRPCQGAQKPTTTTPIFTAAPDDRKSGVADVYHWEREKRPTNPPRDLSGRWNTLTPLDQVAPQMLSRIEWFAESKRITVEALNQLETRAKLDQAGGVTLCFPRYCMTTDGLKVCAIRYRPLDPERGRYCEPGSRLSPPALPQVIGDLSSAEWFVAEGETDAARLWLLTRGEAAVLVLGGTRHAMYGEWDALFHPGVKRIYVALDNDRRRPDEPKSVFRGDDAADVMLARLGQRARRLCPPARSKDWCEL